MSRTKYDIIMLYAFLVSLFIVQAAADAELCIEMYGALDCTGSVSQSQCQTASIDGSCQTESDNGVDQYIEATCTGTTLTWTIFSDATCSGTGTTVTYTDGQCTSGVKVAVNCDASSDPCFADTTTACRINDAAMAPSTAFKQCFGDEASSSLCPVGKLALCPSSFPPLALLPAPARTPPPCLPTPAPRCSPFITPPSHACAMARWTGRRRPRWPSASR